MEVTLRTLKSISSSAESLKSVISPHIPFKNTQSRLSQPILHFNCSLPPPLPIDELLLAEGLPSSICSRISETYIRRSTALSEQIEVVLRRSLTAMASLYSEPNGFRVCRDQMIQSQTTLYLKSLDTMKSEAITLAKRASSAVRKERKKSLKLNFNHEYTPLLEKYFEYNAYPSVPDRAVLARKSMMTPRQIEVWFQNHRSRAKKEGRPLTRLTSTPLPVSLSLASLEQQMPFFTIPKSHRKEPENAANVESLSDDEVSIPKISSTPPPCALSPPAPPHAFPLPYSCHTSYNPFPTEGGTLSFPAPVWTRHSAVPRSSTDPIDMDEFVTTFATKLNLREGPLRKAFKRNEVSRTGFLQPWFAATVTTPFPAPHPALISYPPDPPRSFFSPPSVSPPDSPSSSPKSHSTCRSRSQPRNRKHGIQTSRRQPKHPSVSHYGVDLTWSDVFPGSRYPTPTSRASSSSFDSSSDRSTSSSFTDLPTPSSSPATTPVKLLDYTDILAEELELDHDFFPAPQCQLKSSTRASIPLSPHTSISPPCSPVALSIDLPALHPVG